MTICAILDIVAQQQILVHLMYFHSAILMVKLVGLMLVARVLNKYL